MTKKLLIFYAISPIYAGSGTSLGAVDLPIQRERHTNWPHIQASAVKGALRSHFRTFSENKDLINLIFGLDEQNDGELKGKDGEKIKQKAGVVAFSDAKLFAFPVRSNVAPFVWVTCPSVIKRFNTDLEFYGKKQEELLKEKIVSGDNAFSLLGEVGQNQKIILEDAVINVLDKFTMPNLSNYFPSISKLLLVSDEMFDYLVSTATEVQTQIKIKAETGTAEDGALRYQELLPADSVLYSVVYFKNNALKTDAQEYTVSKVLEDAIKDFVQVGGDETLGRGICKVEWK